MFLFKHISVLIKWRTYLSPVSPARMSVRLSKHPRLKIHQFSAAPVVPPGRGQPSVSPQALLMASSWIRAGWRPCSSAARQCVLLHTPCTRTSSRRQGVQWECSFPGGSCVKLALPVPSSPAYCQLCMASQGSDQEQNPFWKYFPDEKPLETFLASAR